MHDCWYMFCRYQFVPQMIFLNSLFGYLSLLIILKWCTGSKADLYHIMIYMFLSPTDDLEENQLFNGQKSLQVPQRMLLVQFIFFRVHIGSYSLFVFLPSSARIAITGTYFCPMDAVSKTSFLEEAT